MRLIAALDPPESPARVREPSAPPVRVGVVQHAWDVDPAQLVATLREGIATAARAGATIVFLPELTLSRYPADALPTGTPSDLAESLEDGPTVAFARQAAADFGVQVHASLYEKADDEAEAGSGATGGGEVGAASTGGAARDGLGYNCAVVVAPSGEVVARTRKMHIPVTAGYYEDQYFRPGPASGGTGGGASGGGTAYPVVDLSGVKVGLPTCWDEWFPEVARLYALGGAELLCYPTAIGSEPDHPDFDTQPLWEGVITGHAIANGLFIVVPNRYGTEGLITFYGSSFIVDPYGRVLAKAPRDEAAVLVADLDLAQRQDWLDLFPFLATRRPDSYAALTETVRPEHERSS